jgi:hypothetical protein
MHLSDLSVPAVTAAVTAATAVEEAATIEAAVMVAPVVVTGRDVAERGRGAVEGAPVRLRRLASLETAAAQRPQAAGEQQRQPAHPEPRRDLSIHAGEQDAGAREDHERREELTAASHRTVIRYGRAIGELVPAHRTGGTLADAT